MPRRQQSKIRIPKPEIQKKRKHSNLKIAIQNDLRENPKSEYRNTKQFQNLNSQNPKPSNENFSRVVKCFEISILSFPFLFRISDFEFRICNFAYTWRPLPCGVLALVETIQLGRAVTPQGESSFIRFRKHNFKGKFQTRLVRIQRAHDFALVTIYG